MRTNDVQDELAEGFEPTALPPVAPDGSLELPPMRAAPRHPPRLCEQGPCANYHTFTIQLDAAKPLPEKQPDGSMVAAEVRDHVEVHHYCYPSVGIESKLGSLPVIQCNRWHPKTQAELASEEVRHEEWHHSDAGQRYLAELEQYKADQERIAREEAEAIEDASEDLAAMPAANCELRYVIVVDSTSPADSHAGVPILVAWDMTLTDVRERALSGQALRREVHDSYLVHVAIDPPRIFRARRLEPTMTVSQAGLSAGDLLVFSKDTHKETP